MVICKQCVDSAGLPCFAIPQNYQHLSRARPQPRSRSRSLPRSRSLDRLMSEKTINLSRPNVSDMPVVSNGQILTDDMSHESERLSLEKRWSTESKWTKKELCAFNLESLADCVRCRYMAKTHTCTHTCKHSFHTCNANILNTHTQAFVHAYIVHTRAHDTSAYISRKTSHSQPHFTRKQTKLK